MLGDLARGDFQGHEIECRDRIHRPSADRRVIDIETEVMALAELDGSQLRQRWEKMTGSPAPRVSPKLLRLALGYRIQARALGDLSPTARRRLTQAAGGKSVTKPVRAGTRLVREWQGVTYIVTIDENGIIRWNGREWKSLSAVAHAITGGHWSGPAFFGLRKQMRHRSDGPDLNETAEIRQEASPKSSASQIVRRGRAA